MATTVVFPFSGSGTPIVLGTSLSIFYTSLGAVGPDNFDAMYLFVTNTDSVARSVIIAWGATTDPDRRIVYNQSIPADGKIYPIVSGLIINGGAVLYAAAVGTGTRMLLTGYVKRTTA